MSQKEETFKKHIYRAKTLRQDFSENEDMPDEVIPKGVKKIKGIWYAIGYTVEDGYIIPLSEFELALGWEDSIGYYLVMIDSSTLAVATGKLDINDNEIFASIYDKGGDVCKWGHGTPRNGGKPTEQSERIYQAKMGLNGLTWGSFCYNSFIYTDTEKHLEIIDIQK